MYSCVFPTCTLSSCQHCISRKLCALSYDAQVDHHFQKSQLYRFLFDLRILSHSLHKNGFKTSSCFFLWFSRHPTLLKPQPHTSHTNKDFSSTQIPCMPSVMISISSKFIFFISVRSASTTAVHDSFVPKSVESPLYPMQGPSEILVDRMIPHAGFL